MYISDKDLNNLQGLKEKKKNLEREEYILEAKKRGLRADINDIRDAIDEKEIKNELEKKGISVKGGKIELRYSNGTWLAVTMGFDKSWGVRLKIHTMLKSRKGWYKNTDSIGADKIHVIHKATTDFPHSPKFNEEE
jgi:hypothetical protein